MYRFSSVRHSINCLSEKKLTQFVFLSKVSVFDPSTDTFEAKPDLNIRIRTGSCAAFKSAKHGNREVIFIGGGLLSGTNSAELLDYTQTDTWEASKYIHSLNIGWCIKFATGLNGRFTTISSHFVVNYIDIFHKTVVQSVILRC